MKIPKNNLELIDNIINELCNDYTITCKYDNIEISKKVLLNKFRLKLAQEEEVICSGVSQNGKKCYRKAQKDMDYCKIHNHFALQCNRYIEQKSGSFYIIDKKNDDINKKDDLTLEFINDVFYYIDDLYIYDKTTMEKVGYIDSNEFILTDDPFILMDRM